MKYLSYVAVLVVSVAAIIGLYPSKPTEDFTQVRQATWALHLKGVEPFWGAPIDADICSGVAIKPDLLLTAAHCDVSDKIPGSVLTVDGKTTIVVKKDVNKDLMMLFVPDLNSPYVPVGTYVPLQDSPVVLVGYPLGLTQFVTEGRVQGSVELPEGIADHPLPKFLAVSALGEPGNSGGGLFQLVDGKYVLVGITSMKGGMITLCVHPEVIAKFLAPKAH